MLFKVGSAQELVPPSGSLLPWKGLPERVCSPPLWKGLPGRVCSFGVAGAGQSYLSKVLCCWKNR